MPTDTLADTAVRHLLGRLMRDPRLAHQMGEGTEAFDLLTAARAQALGQPVEDVRSQMAAELRKRRWHREMLQWHDAALLKPDADRTVLCWHGVDHEFWTGYWDGAQWIGCESGGTVYGVTDWAEPHGPR